MPLLVIVNVSPLIGLAKAGRLRLLETLYDDVLIPPSVYEDVVTRGRGRTGARAVKNAVRAGWMRVVPVTDRSLIPAEFKNDSEGEVIALALEQQATLAIIDDRKARKTCDLLGIRWLSTAGIIRDAVQAGRVRRAKPIFDRIIANGFGVWDYEAILRSLGELP
ncbi:MAG: hypothetical protein HY314_00320 [Acidobacteria bacterium]|nr:hypothetical protein [Acidobacteriota bacterium]